MVKKNDFRHGAHFFLLLVHRCTVELDPNTSQSKKFLASNFTSCVSWIWVAFLGKRNVLQLQNSHGSQMNNKRRQSILSAARGVLSEVLQMYVLWWWIMGKNVFLGRNSKFARLSKLRLHNHDKRTNTSCRRSKIQTGHKWRLFGNFWRFWGLCRQEICL